MTHQVIHRGPAVIAEAEPPEYHNTVANTTIAGDLVVTPGENWLIGENVIVQGNVLVENATLAMRPGSSLEFDGAVPANYLGGGVEYNSQDNSNDWGIWVWGSGKLDIQGTAKVAWNRTGTDASWDPGDEYWEAPTGAGNWVPSTWTYGSGVTRTPVQAGLPSYPPQMVQDWIDNGIPTEILNVTRDITIKGPAHIHIHNTSPVAHIIKNVRLEEMGVFSNGPVLGRYALHFHHSHLNTSGSVVDGVALVSCKGRGIVPHGSDGVTITNTCSVNGGAEQLFWDVGPVADDSDDIVVDGLCIAGVNVTRAENGNQLVGYNGINLVSGLRVEMKNTAVSGVRGSKLSVAFDWPSPGTAGTIPEDPVLPNQVWIFEDGNLAHNCQGPGIRFWTNRDEPHIVEDFVSYHCDFSAIENGAYNNGIVWTDIYGEGTCENHSNTEDSPVSTFTRCHFVGYQGEPAMHIGRRQLPAAGGQRQQFVDCRFLPDGGAVKVDVGVGFTSWQADFHDCDIGVDDFAWGNTQDADRPPNEGTGGSVVRIYESSALVQTISITDGDIDYTLTQSPAAIVVHAPAVTVV